MDLRSFRPRSGRSVALAAAAVSVILFTTIALLLPGPDEGGPWTPANKLLVVLLGVATAWLLWRFAAIRAIPMVEGLEVRNIFQTRMVPWHDIEAVRFGGGEPWVTLDLHDADTVAVMAIQRADGDVSVDEATRLATLVDRFSRSS